MDIRFAFRGAFDALTGAKKILTVSHRKPDGDTLGAAAAIIEFCRSRGIEAAGFCVDPVPDQYAYLPGAESFTTDPRAITHGDHDLLVVLDAGDLRFAGVAELVDAARRGPPMVCFDHHATNEGYGDINVIDAGASSTAEVVYRFFEACGVDISRELAVCLLTGIFTDTSYFTNPATSSQSLEAASRLIRRGVKLQDLTDRFINNKSVAGLRVWGRIMSRLKYNEALGIASTAVFEEDSRDFSDDDRMDSLTNFLSGTLDAKVLLILKEVPGGQVKGSFRTTGDTDVSAVAKLLGGGGHRKAAGFIMNGRIAETPGGWRIE